MTQPPPPAAGNSPKRILLCGHRSFASQGLIEVLRSRGHHVVTFSRGPEKRQGDDAAGPVDRLHENPHLAEEFDTVLNYILLKDADIAGNDLYLASLLKFCAARNVKHLVHVSSMSVYKGEVSRVHEEAELETVPQRKGSYGSLKVAQDLFLNQNAPSNLRLSMFRPGFVLAPGLLDPMIGMALRMFRNKVLLLGAKNNHLPVVTREQVHEAMARVVESQEASKRDAFLIADPDSPTRLKWLQACCELLGCGTEVVSFPPILWRLAGWFGEPVARMAGMKISPAKIMSNVCRVQTFDTRKSQEKLGMSMAVDWQAALRASFAGQQTNFQLPYSPSDLQKQQFSASRVTFIGYGQVVKQKHLPALKRLKFAGQIDAIDLLPRQDPDGQVIRAAEGATIDATDLIVVASPGTAHAAAIPLIRSSDAPVLVEKPLCYTKAELAQWMELANSRSAPIRVCQNYRFKSHVIAMLDHLGRYNPGQLLRVDLTFQSPSVGKDWRTWARDERPTRTLLMDYSVHYLDVACMFNTETWKLETCRHELDYLGYTGLIEGRLTSPAYAVNFVLRQGLMPRRARLLLTFQNYSVSLGFYPDTFVPHMSDDGAAIYNAEKKAAARATRRKILDKVTNRDSDHSHSAVYLAALSEPTGLGKSIGVQNLAAYYAAVFDIGQAVYE